MLGIQRQVHIVHTLLNLRFQEELERLLRDVFGAETYYKSYEKDLDRDASLVLVGEMCIEPLSKRFELAPVGSAKWIRTNGQRFHSVAFKVEDVRPIDERLAQHGLERYYTNPEYRNVFFLTEPEDSFNAIIEFCRVEMPGDPRIEPGWSAAKWRDEHPLQIERLSSIGAVVRDLEEPRRLWGEILGFQPLGERVVESDGTRVASYWAGESIFELAQPVERRTLADDYLRLRGEGWLSVNFKVRSAQAAADYLRAQGLRLIGDLKRRFYIDPRDTYDAVYGFVEDEIPGDPRAIS